MKTQEFEKKDGTTGYSHTVEAGDVVVAKFPSVKTFNSNGFDNHSLGVLHQGEEKYIKLTNGQKNGLDAWMDRSGVDLTGREITFEEYTNTYGTFVGPRVGDKVQE